MRTSLAGRTASLRRLPPAPPSLETREGGREGRRLPEACAGGSASSGALAALHWRRGAGPAGAPVALLQPRGLTLTGSVRGQGTQRHRPVPRPRKLSEWLGPVSPQARGSPLKLPHLANTGTTFPPVAHPRPVPGAPGSRFTLWREGRAPTPVGWPGRGQSRCCASRQCPATAKVPWPEQAARPPGKPAACPSTLAAGGPAGVLWGQEAGSALLTASLGPRPKHKGGTCPLAPVPTRQPTAVDLQWTVHARGGAHGPSITRRVFQVHPRCTTSLGPLCGQ